MDWHVNSLTMPQRKPIKAEEIRLITTADGSHTLYNERLGVHYRSIDGAAAESQYVFIEGTRICTRDGEWKVLELGFGAGLNFSNLAKLALQLNRPLSYQSLDHQPIPPEILPSCGHTDLDQLIKQALTVARTEHCRQKHRLGNITLELIPFDRSELTPQASWANAIFHDPFGPHANPQAWTLECFEWMFKAMQPDAILATFGAAGHARRAMAAAGFTIASRPGWGRKREMTVASPSKSSLLLDANNTIISKYPPGMVPQ